MCIDNIQSISFQFLLSDYEVEEPKASTDRIRYGIDIYIGSDNDSRKIHDSYLNKVREWTNTTFPHACTIFKGEGYTTVLQKTPSFFMCS